MEELAIGRLFAGVKRPLAQALDLLAPHFPEINSSWRTLLASVSLTAEDLAALSRLTLQAHREELRGGKFAAFKQALQHQAHELAQNGVPEEHAIAALSFYLESCLPYLSSDGARDNEMALALARVVSASELLLVSSYAELHHESRRTLEQKLRRAEQRLRGFSIHLMNISEQDRSRLSRDLHDEIGHNLLVLKLYMEMMSLDLKEGNAEQVTQKLDEAVDLVAQAIEGVRRLAFNLGPAILDEMGFLPSLKRYSRQFTARTGIQVRVNSGRLPELPSSYEVAFYRVFQGALSNVAEHSRARHVRVMVGSRKDSVVMSIEDDGIGFDLQKKLREPNQAFGLMAMRQRIELLGGTIHAESRAAGAAKSRHGTRIEVNLPLMELDKNGQ